jgi:hypothetical protein
MEYTKALFYSLVVTARVGIIKNDIPIRNKGLA